MLCDMLLKANRENSGAFLEQLYQQICLLCIVYYSCKHFVLLHIILSSTNTYVKCSGALKSSRAIKQLVSEALLDLIDHDITNCGLSHDLGGSGGTAVSMNRVGGGDGGAPLTW